MKALSDIELELLPGQVNGPLRYDQLFGRRAPIELEVGIGKGRFVLEQASCRPEIDFLALEWSLKHMRVALERARRKGLFNIRFHRADARHVLADLIPEASVDRLHVYCPDPWPKKRHHKRRFFTPAMVPHLERILIPGGFLNLSTDVGSYFEVIREVIAEYSGLTPAIDPLFPAGTAGGKTNYEVKYLAEGRIIHRASYTRLPRA